MMIFQINTVGDKMVEHKDSQSICSSKFIVFPNITGRTSVPFNIMNW